MQGVSRMRESNEVRMARTRESKQKVLDCFSFDDPICAKDLKGKLDIPYGTYRTYIYHLFQDGYLKLDRIESQRAYYVKTEEIIAPVEYVQEQKIKKEPWRFIPYKIEHLVHDIPVPKEAITEVKGLDKYRTRIERTRPRVYVGSTANMI